MKRIPFKICILLVVILGIFILMMGIYKTDSLNISNLDRQEKIIKISEYYNFKWGPSHSNNNNQHPQETFTPKVSTSSNNRNIRSSSDEIQIEKEISCQSTVQGNLYIADDQGYVCSRSSWDSISKCCKKQTRDIKQVDRSGSNNSNNNNNNNSISNSESKDNNNNNSNNNSNNSESKDSNNSNNNSNNNSSNNSSNNSNGSEANNSLINNKNQNNQNNTLIERYSCKRCLEGSDCCDTYEYCISCCMRYDKVPVVQEMLITFAERGVAKEYLKNQFDLCTMACRTSSSSLLNQREYQNPKFKFCYGPNIAKI